MKANLISHFYERDAKIQKKNERNNNNTENIINRKYILRKFVCVRACEYKGEYIDMCTFAALL